MKAIQFTVPVVYNGSVCVQEDILPGFYSNYHRHKELQLTYILKGQGTFLIGNLTHDFKADEIYIVDANEPHMFKTASNWEEGIHAIHIFFDYTHFKAFLDFPEFDHVRYFLEHIQVSKKLNREFAKPFRERFVGINASSGLDRLLSFVKLIDLMCTKVDQWTSLYTSIPQKRFSDAEGLRINDIFQYTFQHYRDKVSLEDIAGVAHMTPHAFCKYFKKHTRKTYVTFLNEIRVDRACKLLVDEASESVADVAFKTGFNNVVNFNRVFKKITGVSPSEYVLLHRVQDL